MNSNRTDRAGSRGGFFSRMGRVMNRAVAAASYRFHIAAANSWRDQYNPLRALTIQRAVCLLEEGERGAYADVQWTYRYIEMQDATLGALIERRTSAIQQLDWDIKVRDDVPENKKAVAERQQEALRNAYEGCSNLSAALEFLAMASFRGFAHLEKVVDGDGRLMELTPVEQWFWVRGGLYGKWLYNKDAKFGTVTGDEVDLSRFVIREVSRPVNRVALVCFVRKGLSQKDWDGFIEAFGIPAVFIIMPESVPADQEDDYLTAADAVSSDARGVLPGGSDVKTVDNGARGTNPFKEHLEYQDSQVVLRGTGGKLTMLSEATGIGGGSTSAHEETFEQIAKAEAAEISEVLRKQVDREVIESVTPGERAWAYFELAANEETDTTKVIADVVALKGAGFAVKREWIEEKTGYEFEENAETPKAETLKGEGPGDEVILNREEDVILNKSGWRTLDDGRRVLIENLEGADDGDKSGTKSKTETERKKKVDPAQPFERFDYMKYGEKLKIPEATQKELAEFYEKEVEMPDGRRGKVTGYNIKTGVLTIAGKGADWATVPWNDAKILNREAGDDGEGSGGDDGRTEVRAPFAGDLQALGREIAAALQAEESERGGLLQSLSKRLPEMLSAPELEEWLGVEMAKAFTDGAVEAAKELNQ